MVCIRCKMAVQAVLEGLHISYQSIELGRIKLSNILTEAQQEGLRKGLHHYGLQVIEDKNKVLVERIKTEIIKVLQSPHDMRLKLSAYLSNALQYNYNYLSNVFSEVEGMTLEKYFIVQRIEKVKEFLVYHNLTLTQISDELNYSGVSHLCLQFKKVTGLTPAEFKKRCWLPGFVWRSV